MSQTESHPCKISAIKYASPLLLNSVSLRFPGCLQEAARPTVTMYPEWRNPPFPLKPRELGLCCPGPHQNSPLSCSPSSGALPSSEFQTPQPTTRDHMVGHAYQSSTQTSRYRWSSVSVTVLLLWLDDLRKERIVRAHARFPGIALGLRNVMAVGA